MTADSAFRVSSQEYESRVISFTITTAAIGGGALRFADSFFGVANPTIRTTEDGKILQLVGFFLEE